MIFETVGAGENPARLSYGEPWGFSPGIELDELRLIDIRGRIAAIVTGVLEERLETAERIAACVNFCAGNSTEFLSKLKSAAGAATGPRRAVEPLSWPREEDRILRGLRERNDQRDALMVLLFHTARALAAAQITIATGIERITLCAACGEQTPIGIPARHRAMCLAAEIHSIVARLFETLEPNLKRKENA
jgi:hypothetical protein